MLKKLGLLKTEYKSLETKLMAELKKRSPNRSKIKKLKKLMLNTRASMLGLLNKKYMTRRLRYKRRARRLSHPSVSILAPARYNMSF